MRVELELELEVPSVPNFIFFKMPPSSRREWFFESPKMSLGELTDDKLIEIAEEWKKKLLERAAEQRKGVRDGSRE